jgi:hypothetical protein
MRISFSVMMNRPVCWCVVCGEFPLSIATEAVGAYQAATELTSDILARETEEP